MIRKIFKKNKIKNKYLFVEPDEIFLDSKNLPNFDTQQFEGRIERPISMNTVMYVGVFFFIFCTIFLSRLYQLQIQKGDTYLKRSENNTLEEVVLFADRGIIFDRNMQELAWNKKGNESDREEDTEFLNETKTIDVKKNKKIDQETEQILDENTVRRVYASPGFSHVLGYVSSPAKDKSGKYWQTDFVGKDGLEKQYSEMIKGKNGSKLVETDARGEVHSENIVNAPARGKDLVTSIDARLQKRLYKLIKEHADKHGFLGGAGIIMDVRNGELVVSTSYPEYDSSVLSAGSDSEKIKEYLTDKRKVFIDKSISGLYTPGSIVKPFFALGGLAENIISPKKEILSTGSITIPNPFDKEKETKFKDWKAHGWTDMSEAIAVSSDVYFYALGGGYKDQKGLGITRLEKYARMFGIGQKTGVDLPDETEGNIPNPQWKSENFKGDIWRIGDTYNTAIGQYGFQVTPLEMVRAISALANYGTLLTPHFLLDDREKEAQISKIELPREYFDEVHLGMREAVTYGTALALNVPYVDVAAKTGSAQVGAKKNRINSWVVGFFPYENPKYAFAVMMEAGPTTAAGATTIMRDFLDWMSLNTKEYFE